MVKMIIVNSNPRRGQPPRIIVVAPWSPFSSTLESSSCVLVVVSDVVSAHSQTNGSQNCSTNAHDSLPFRFRSLGSGSRLWFYRRLGLKRDRSLQYSLRSYRWRKHGSRSSIHPHLGMFTSDADSTAALGFDIASYHSVLHG